MMPALALIGVGAGRRWVVPIPVPLFLIWPLIALAWLGIEVATRLSRTPSPALASARVGLAAFAQLRGLKVDASSADDRRVLIWFI